MHFQLAMGMTDGKPKLVTFRTGSPEIRVAYRFGEPVLLNSDPTAKRAWVAYTPTQEDMRADDWEVHDENGNRLEPIARTAEPGAARGGTGAGTGWRRA